MNAILRWTQADLAEEFCIFHLAGKRLAGGANPCGYRYRQIADTPARRSGCRYTISYPNTKGLQQAAGSISFKRMMVAFPSRGVLKKSAIETIICAAISISVSTGIRFYLGVQSDTITIIVRLILPFMIAFPIAIMLFAKIEKLEKAYRSLLKEARELAKCASTDPLRGLLNRRSFERQFNLAIAHRRGGKFIIADMDLNRTGFAGGSNFQIGWSHDEQNNEQVFP